MHTQLLQHLNAEIASSGYMHDVPVCIAWLKSTYLWARISKNPLFYQLPRGLSEGELRRSPPTSPDLP